MKKNIYFLILVVISVVCCVSCNNEWEDEQFQQLVSFKATPDANGVTVAYLHYLPEGEVTYQLPIIVSGSTPNAQKRTVRIALDHDTLTALNEARYGHQTDLYFKELDPKYYSFPETVEIPAGQSLATLPIKFTLGDLDQSDKWVLPLTIVDDPSYDYQANPRKHYRKALLRITPYNDYSGKYASTKVVLAGDNANPLTVGENWAYVVDNNTIFMYAGSRNIDNKDRKKYKINIRFTDEVVDPLAGTKKLEVWSDNSDIKLNVTTPTYSKTEKMDAVKTYLKLIDIVLNLSYSFEDYTTVPGFGLKYSVDGPIGLRRSMNTLIPDQDQQIQWE